MYWESEELAKLGKKVIKTYGDLRHLDDPQCRIAYQYCDKEKKGKGKLVLADTELVKDKIKVFFKADFLITVYAGSCVGLDEERMERLMYHELKHIGYEAPDEFYIIPHDIEDFRSVVDKWGTDWVRK